MWYFTEKITYKSNEDFDQKLTLLNKNDGWRPIWIKELLWDKNNGCGMAIVKFEIQDR